MTAVSCSPSRHDGRYTLFDSDEATSFQAPLQTVNDWGACLLLAPTGHGEPTAEFIFTTAHGRSRPHRGIIDLFAAHDEPAQILASLDPEPDPLVQGLAARLKGRKTAIKRPSRPKVVVA